LLIEPIFLNLDISCVVVWEEYCKKDSEWSELSDVQWIEANSTGHFHTI